MPLDDQNEDEIHQIPVEVEERQDATAQADDLQEQPIPAHNPPDQQGEHVSDTQPVRCDRDPLRILRSRTRNKERQYLVRYEQSWEPAETLKKIQENFPYRVLRRCLTGGKPYCLVRWKDTWEPADKCSNALIMKYNIARANKKRTKKPRPQPRHEYFLRSNEKQSGPGDRPLG